MLQSVQHDNLIGVQSFSDRSPIIVITLLYNTLYYHQDSLRCDLKGVAAKGDFFLFASLPFPYLCSVIRRGSHW